MKVLIQRVSGRTNIEIKCSKNDSFDGPGLLVLLGWLRSDQERSDLEQAEDWLLSRILGLRIFPDAQGKMNLSLAQYCADNQLTSAGILWVSQFTLGAELESGYRPSFTTAMNPELARTRYHLFVQKVLKSSHNESPVKHIFGEFGADMTLQFSNWGPVTIPLER